MNDSVGIASTVLLGILAAYAVVGWVRSQTNKARQDLEVQVAELKAANASLTRQRDNQQGTIKFLKDETALLHRRLHGAEQRARTQPFGTYPEGKSQVAPRLFADGHPTFQGADTDEYHETRKATEKELREIHHLPRLPNCQP